MASKAGGTGTATRGRTRKATARSGTQAKEGEIPTNIADGVSRITAALSREMIAFKDAYGGMTATERKHLKAALCRAFLKGWNAGAT